TTPPIGGIQIYSDNVKITNSNIGYSPVGIYVDFSSPIISQNMIKNNVYGIYLWHSAPTISDNIIENNTYGIYGTNVPPIIQVISPNGGEIWRGIKTILWSAYDPDNKDIVETVTIKYSIDGVTWNLIVENTENDGAHGWNTALFPDSTNYLIKIEGSDGVLVGEDKSDGVFTVDNTPPIVKIISPEDKREYQYTDGPIPINYTVEDAIDPYPEKAVFLDGDLTTLDYIDVDALSLGVHELKVIATDHAGNVATATVTFFVVKEGTILRVGDAIVEYNDSVILTAMLTDDDISPNNVVGRNISFYVNNESVGLAVTNTDGMASLSYIASVSPGTYTIKAEFEGDNVYEASSSTATLIVRKEVTITTYIGDFEGYCLDYTVLKASLTDDEYNPLANKEINFTLGKQKASAITNNYGIAEVSIILIQVPGVYNLTAEFVGNDFYLSSSYSGIFTIKEVRKKGTKIEYTGDTKGQYSDEVTLIAVLKDENNIPVPNKKIEFTLGVQKANATTDKNGIAKVSIRLEQPAGNYYIFAEFKEDAYYLGSNVTQPFSILHEDTILVYTGDLEGAYSDKVVVSAILTDPDNGGIEGKNITFRIGSQSIIAKTNKTGFASAELILKQPSGTYAVRAEFEGDEYYLSSFDEKIFIIHKEETILK
ncbi:MAG: Ig-like domain repeat protein, partial [Candidatus Thermoplasmatota archaeon]